MKSFIFVLLLLGMNTSFAQEAEQLEYQDSDVQITTDEAELDCSLLVQDDVLTEDEYYDLLGLCSEADSHNKARGEQRAPPLSPEKPKQSPALGKLKNQMK